MQFVIFFSGGRERNVDLCFCRDCMVFSFAKVKPFIVQGVVWTGLSVLIFFIHSTLPSSRMPSVFVRVFGLAVVFNLHQIVYRQFFARRRYTLYGVLLAVAVVAMGIAMQAYRAWSMPGVVSLWNVAEIVREIMGCAICLGMVLGVYMFVRQLRSQYQMQEARALQAGAELKMLQAQINPHFLFNTMHCLYTLIELRSEKAQEVVLAMSDLMRYMYQAANTEMVCLREEMENIERLLQLQRIRLGRRADVQLSVEGDPGLWKIPPMLLLTLVENAFKHGVESTSASAGASLRIGLDTRGERMTFCVENTVGRVSDAAIKEAEPSAKTGLANVRRRLELLYPSAHELCIKSDERFFSVTVKLWKTAHGF